MSWQVEAICAGRAVGFGEGEQSAIAKQPLEGLVQFQALGIAGDQQADLVHHGGPDMAVHHYPLDHHEYWREELGNHALLAHPGAFGSNIALRGVTEGDVALGSRFRLGTVLLEACQPRQPCWKIEHRFGEKAMIKRILSTGRCGWFYRVIEEGEAQATNRLEQVSEGLTDWPMARIFEAIWGTASPRDDGLLAEIASLPALAGKLRIKVLGMIG